MCIRDRIYVDGYAIDSGDGLATGETIDTGGTLLLGHDQDSNGGDFGLDQVFGGTFFDVRVWDHAPTDTDVAAVHLQKLNPNIAHNGLIANWQFDGFDGTEVVDIVSGNNLTVEHVTEPGFTPGMPAGDLTVDENSSNGTSIGFVIATGGQVAMGIDQILANDSSLTYDETTGKIYRAVEGNFRWDDANAGATSAVLGGVSGQLVTIRSQYENDLVQGLANALSTPENLWIGASDQNTEGNWHWYADGIEDSADLFYVGQDPNGSAQSGAYTNWRVGDPSANGASEDFALLKYTTGQWDDADISAATGSYIIEWDDSKFPDSVVFALSNDAGGRFTIDSATGEITVANGALLNHEANQTHVVTVVVSDSTGNLHAEDFTITVNNVNESPTFEESVTPVFTENTATTSAFGAAPLASGDVDGDGDLDLFSTGSGTTIVWYENDSTGGFTVNTVDDVSNVSALTLTDVDSDGDTDLVVATSSFFSDGLVWYENDGSQNFTEHTITTATRGANSVTTADVDSDGDIDVLVASSDDDSITWYENDGSQNFSDHIISNANADGATSVATADVDGDGDLDVLSASFGDNKIAWYENDGSQGITERVVDSSFASARSVTCLLYTSPSPRDATLSRMPSSA